MRNHPDAALRLIEALAQRLATAEQMIGDLSLRDVGQRLATELCRMAPYGRHSVPIREKLKSPAAGWIWQTNWGATQKA